MTEPDPLLGSTIGGIRLDEMLGTGGMGTVYRGFQTGMARVVAVKILSEHLSSNAEYISRFRREAVTAGKLEHANIVTIYDIGHEGGRYFIVMQYVEGRSLQRILDVVGPLPPREAAGLMVGVLRGLQNAHAAGIVHRDIKPGNIIVTKENEPKILDFGLAVGLDPRDRVTGTGSVLGTPLYISPEQARGKPPEPRSDLYSTGVMFYALLTGRVPFSGQDPLAVLNMHIQEKPVSPMNLNPRIPQALNDIVLKMLAKHPEERHPNAEAAARDIQAFLDGKLLALPPRPAPRLVRRQAAPVGIIVGVVLGLIFLVGLAKLSKSPPTDPPAPPKVQGTPSGPDPELVEVREKAEAILAVASKDGARDYAVYPHSMGELNRLAARYANRKDSAAVLDAAKKTLTDAAERFARTHEAEIRPRVVMARAEGDVYLMRELLREFPRPFLDLTETGRAVAREIKETEVLIGKRIAADLESIPRLIDADEFDGARARLKRLGDVVPPELRSRVAELLAQTDAAEAERRLQLIPRLLGQIAAHEQLLSSLLDRRQSDEAWNLVLGFVESHPPTKLAASLVRMTAVPIATLRRVVPSTETEEVIDSLLLRFEAEDPAKDEDLPPNRLRNLCEDILRWSGSAGGPTGASSASPAPRSRSIRSAGSRAGSWEGPHRPSTRAPGLRNRSSSASSRRGTSRSSPRRPPSGSRTRSRPLSSRPTTGASPSPSPRPTATRPRPTGTPWPSSGRSRPAPTECGSRPSAWRPWRRRPGRSGTSFRGKCWGGRSTTRRRAGSTRRTRSSTGPRRNTRTRRTSPRSRESSATCTRGSSSRRRRRR
jgi:predicted Ser/Thr protein kinase